MRPSALLPGRASTPFSDAAYCFTDGRPKTALRRNRVAYGRPRDAAYGNNPIKSCADLG